MVHHVPDQNGRMHFHRDANRCGYFIGNFDQDNLMTVTVEGNPTFYVQPLTYIIISDSVGIETTMENNSRNYTVLEYSAGSEF